MRLHLSNSTIAGAAGMLAAAQRRAGHDAVYFQFSDNGPQRQIFAPEVLTPADSDDWREIFRIAVRSAEVVHVHNWLPQHVESILLEELSRSKALRVWQLHQGQYERPVHIVEGHSTIPWDRRLIVAHAFARTVDDFIPVPNCLYRETSQLLGKQVIAQRTCTSEILRVIFSPSTSSQSRWGMKSDMSFVALIAALDQLTGVSLHLAEDEPPNTLFARRMNSDVSIDELKTGGFHLVSYEGLCAGNVVINDADSLAMELFRRAINANRPPPFLRLHQDDLLETLIRLRNDTQLRQKIQRESREYFLEFMNYKRIVDIYEKIYFEA